MTNEEHARDQRAFEEKLKEKLHFSISSISEYSNVLVLIFDTLYALVYKQKDASSLTIFHIKTLEHFVFVDNLPTLLMTIFGSKGLISNRNEIHNEILYQRVFEQSENFSPQVTFFINKLKEEADPKYIYVLRKICVISGSPLPLIQV